MKSISKIRHMQESNRKLERRLLNEQVATGAVQPTSGQTVNNDQEEPSGELIVPNLKYFSTTPSGTLVVNNLGSVLDSVNGVGVDEYERNMNSLQLIKGGTYQYKYEPLVKTMRAPTKGEPVVKVFQGGAEVGEFYPNR